MKTLLFIIALITLASSSFSQSTSTGIKTKDYYLTKSKYQRTIGWVMLGGGVALTGLAFAITSINVVIDDVKGNNITASRWKHSCLYKCRHNKLSNIYRRHLNQYGFRFHGLSLYWFH